MDADQLKLIEQLAKLLTGIQAPGSMNVLGAGDDPWCKIRVQLHLHGWHDEKDAKVALMKVFRL